MTLGIYTHPDCLRHDTGSRHPENAGRLTAILEALRSCSFAESLRIIEAPLAEDAMLLLAHTRSYIENIKQFSPSEGLNYLDADTVMSPGTLQAVLRAAGAACRAVDDVMAGKYTSAFCAIRPPGHHATADKAMGFCFFNHVAIAARYAITQHDLERVAIVDFDVHHGNGTQDIVEHDKQVLYISTHQSPLFPGTGKEKSTENILNLPLSAGTDGALYRHVFTQSVMTALETFAPQLILVSAGFDGHRDDPLANFNLVEADYQWIGKQLRKVADRSCGGKLISTLEGGYDHHALAASVVAYLSSFV